jgi:hypothetical protein
MIFWYTARNFFNQFYDDPMNWQSYKEWSRLLHLKELISLDDMLCELAFEIDRESEELYKYYIVDDYYGTDLFNSLDYVLSHVTGKKNFNLLTVVKEPGQECRNIELEGFEFVGYDLLDHEYEISALSNCGGFDEIFLPTDLNEFGLLNDYDKAVDVQRRLVENNPEEHQAYCNLFALWRHKTIGKRKE